MEDSLHPAAPGKPDGPRGLLAPGNSIGPGESIEPNERLVLPIHGMSCASCVRHVEKALSGVPGVQRVAVNLATESATVEGSRLAPRSLREAVEAAGYEVPLDETPATSSSEAGDSLAAAPASTTAAPINAAERRRREHDAALGHDVLVALLLATPLVLPMLLSPLGIEWSIPAWWQWALATPVQFWSGRRFYVAAWKAVRARTGNMDLLVSIGTLAAYGLSVYLAWRHASGGHAVHLYFEASAVVIALVLLGRWLEARARRRTGEAIRALAALRPAVAHRLQADAAVEPGVSREVDVPLEQVRRGDRLVVRAGERFPVDGLVRAGATTVDESMLTGESLPVERDVGDIVRAGSLNTDGRTEIEATAIGGETMLAQIIRLVEDAQAAKPPVQRLVDRIAAVFVPVVLVIAAITAAGWIVFGGPGSGSFEVALINAVSVLVIACPCALGLATPTAIIAGTGVAARAGVLIKDVEALELARTVTVVAFDKTGTLTAGQPRLVAVETTSGIDRTQALRLALAAGSASTHPLSAAVRDAASADAVGNSPSPDDARVVSGRGAAARLDSEELFFGNERWMRELHVDLAAWTPRAKALADEGRSVSWLARRATGTTTAPTAMALFAFADTPKPGAKAAIAELHRMGIQTVMISGDNEGAARGVARELGIDRYDANVLPGDKAARVAALKQSSAVVAMVGDGINDAPALAAADVGFAMAAAEGTDVAMHAAGVTLLRGDPQLVPAAIRISRATVRKIRQNLFWAFAYNVVGIPLAAFGLLTPVMAGAAMALSSVSVVSNALLLRRFKP